MVYPDLARCAHFHGENRVGVRQPTRYSTKRLSTTTQREGGPTGYPIQSGDPIVCVDYSSKSVPIGSLFWTGIDFGAISHLGGKPRTALSEPEKKKKARNQCVILHLATAYGWVPQGCPRRPPSLPRVQTVSTQIRQEEYQQALRRMESVLNPLTLRDYELAPSAHDALSAYHDRSFEDLDLFLRGMFQSLDLTLLAIEAQIEAPLSSSRSLVFPSLETFDISRAMALGVWGSHTRLLLPSAETLPSSWKLRRGAIGAVVYRRWGD